MPTQWPPSHLAFSTRSPFGLRGRFARGRSPSAPFEARRLTFLTPHASMPSEGAPSHLKGRRPPSYLTFSTRSPFGLRGRFARGRSPSAPFEARRLTFLIPHTSHLIPHTSHLIPHTSYLKAHVVGALTPHHAPASSRRFTWQYASSPVFSSRRCRLEPSQ